MILKVKYYRVYDLTRKYFIKLDCRTVEEARNCIKEDDAERRKNGGVLLTAVWF